MSSSKYYSFTHMLMIVWCSISLALHLQAFFTNSLHCREEERATLLHFKSSLTYHNSSALNSWIPTTDCCRWKRVSCDPSTGHVIELLLDGANISCQLPTHLNSSRLPMLRFFDLSDNRIRGIIPAWLFEFPSLTSLILSKNQFSSFSQAIKSPVVSPLEITDLAYNNIIGTIPAWLFEFPSLKDLYLSVNLFTGFSQAIISRIVSPLHTFAVSANNLQGSIPKPILEIKSLQILWLSENNLTGTIFFSQLFKLRNLTMLALSDNNLFLVDDMYNNDTAGQLLHHYSWPQFIELHLSFCNLCQFPTFLRGQLSLEHLDLHNNHLHGVVPEWMFQVGRDTLKMLDLSNNSLIGRLDRLLWPNLTYIGLHFNMFEGPIPSSLCDMNSIKVVDLGRNKFSGNLPTCLGNVNYIFTSHNQFSGNLPTCLGKVTYFDISNNQFSGNLPTCLGNVTYFNISHNQFSGNLPTCIGKLFNSLIYFDISHNQFNGTIPSMIFEPCEGLKVLGLDQNQFSGQIPKSLAKCSYLVFLNLANNKFTDTFPYWLETLPNLKFLMLGSNNIYGPLLISPNTTSSYSKLQFLDLSNNKLNGGLSSNFLSRCPTMIHGVREGEESFYVTMIINVKGVQRFVLYLPNNLMSIDISNNQFQGRIPISIGDLAYLKWLNLSHNNFTGHIPSSLAKVSQLESMDLSSNQLNGRIPNDLAKLNFLEVFNVSNNNLVGTVPTANQFSTFQDGSYQHNPGLCGPFLKTKCDHTHSATTVPPLKGEEKDLSPSFTFWGFVFMGCSCGVVVGLVAGYFLFIKRTSMFLVRYIVWLETLLKSTKTKRSRN